MALKAKIVVREHDKETDSYAVLDIIQIPVPKTRKEILKLLDTTLTRFFEDAHTPLLGVSDINIEFIKD